MAVEIAAEKVAKRLGYKDGLKDLQWQVVGRWSRCFWSPTYRVWKESLLWLFTLDF